MRKAVPPVVEPVGVNDEVLRHPAFGSIRLSRTQGGIRLFGSQFKHSNYISIDICLAEGTRKYSADGHRSQRPVLRLAMAEPAFHSFISSHGLFEGTPVTLQRIGEEDLPEIAEPEQSSRSKISGEARAKLESVLEQLSEMEQLLQQSGMPKSKASPMLERLRSASMELSGGLDFILSCFGEEMEAVVTKAAQEIRGQLEGARTQYALATAAYARGGELAGEPGLELTGSLLDDDNNDKGKS